MRCTLPSSSVDFWRESRERIQNKEKWQQEFTSIQYYIHFYAASSSTQMRSKNMSILLYPCAASKGFKCPSVVLLSRASLPRPLSYTCKDQTHPKVLANTILSGRINTNQLAVAIQTCKTIVGIVQVWDCGSSGRLLYLFRTILNHCEPHRNSTLLVPFYMT